MPGNDFLDFPQNRIMSGFVMESFLFFNQFVALMQGGFLAFPPAVVDWGSG
jgi:hypothetical protein